MAKTKRADTKRYDDPKERANFAQAAGAQHRHACGNLRSWRLCKREVCRGNQAEYEQKFVVHGKDS